MRIALIGLLLAAVTLGCGSSSSASSCQQYYANNVPGISTADQSFCLNQSGKQAGNCCVSNSQCISGVCCGWEQSCGARSSCECVGP
jgi:hypothetical protein